MEIRVSATYSPENLKRALNLLKRKTTQNQRKPELFLSIKYLIPTVGLAICLFLMQRNYPELSGAIVFVAVGIALGVVGVAFFLIRSAKTPTCDPASELVGFLFRDSEIEVKTNLYTTIYPWTSIYEVICDSRLWLLVTKGLDGTDQALLVEAKDISEELEKLLKDKVPVINKVVAAQG